MRIFEFMLILSVPILLEAAALRIIALKIKNNRKFHDTSEEMSAEVIKIDTQKYNEPRARYTCCTFLLKADNGKLYEIKKTGFKANRIRLGDTVRILVPEGTPEAAPQNERFDQIIANPKELLHTLTEEEKIRLNEYLDQRADAVMKPFHSGTENKRAVFASDGSGLVSEIIGFCILAVLMAGFIAFLVYLAITQR